MRSDNPAYSTKPGYLSREYQSMLDELAARGMHKTIPCEV
jgi:hypothetical protein